jgi:hypothetical protein
LRCAVFAVKPTQLFLEKIYFFLELYPEGIVIIQGSIYCLAWSPKGSLIATGSNDKAGTRAAGPTLAKIHALPWLKFRPYPG